MGCCLRIWHVGADGGHDLDPAGRGVLSTGGNNSGGWLRHEEKDRITRRELTYKKEGVAKNSGGVTTHDANVSNVKDTNEPNATSPEDGTIHLPAKADSPSKNFTKKTDGRNINNWCYCRQVCACHKR